MSLLSSRIAFKFLRIAFISNIMDAWKQYMSSNDRLTEVEAAGFTKQEVEEMEIDEEYEDAVVWHIVYAWDDFQTPDKPTTLYDNEKLELLKAAIEVMPYGTYRGNLYDTIHNSNVNDVFRRFPDQLKIMGKN